VNQRPDLPVFSLRYGAYEADILDPRADPQALGARFVHGGYVASVKREGLELTAQPHPAWSAYEGCGLPEVFEWPLGLSFARPGEELLRVGAGRCLCPEGPGIPGSHVALSSSLMWRLEEETEQTLQMSCSDEMSYGNQRIAYQLIRRVQLQEDGLDSRTELQLEVPWNLPVAWFAHPYVPQPSGEATTFVFPQGASDPHRDVSLERFSFAAEGGLQNVVGLWGANEAIRMELDELAGGGCLDLQLDRPLDHVVLFATRQAASPEPQLCRAWKNGERSAWTLRYRWRS